MQEVDKCQKEKKKKNREKIVEDYRRKQAKSWRKARRNLEVGRRRIEKN